MNKCPKCGDTTGYYMLSRVSGYARSSYNWDDSQGDSSDMHDSIQYHYLKTKRCLNCHTTIKSRSKKLVQIYP